ncbi:MAG: T9SS type A sorting domain-containing protein [Chitinophagales bacterium]|nr:T9SS type A sorting domain-containing protein [Chitinophagales bacterium]
MMRKSNLSSRLLLLMLLLSGLPASAQEQMLPLRFNPKAEAGYAAAVRSPLALPFVDDFSYDGPGPDPQRWINRQAYVNPFYAINPPSIGVATLDGLDAFGYPYDTTSFKLNVIGGADTLTSQPLLLGLLTPADSLYLSFFYQAGGLSDFPNTSFFNSSNYGIPYGDSLVLEFKDAGGVWRKVWAADGVTAPTPFVQVLVAIKSPAFFHNDFQFRFRNYANLIGQYDCWHIDFVRLDKNRSAANDVLNDAAMQYAPSSLLKNYRTMPWKQFYAYQNKERASQIYSSIRINRNQPTNITTQLAAVDQATGQQIHLSPQNAYNLPALSSTPVQHSGFALPNLSADTVVIKTKFFLIPGFSGDLVADNDTAYGETVFSNVLAYDDGSAEAVYRLLGSPASLALRFVLNTPDTLRGMQIYFPRTDADLNNQLINLFVWKSLVPEDSLLRDELIFPAYGAGRDGFVFYRFSRPLYIQDTFYIGWQQVSLLTDMKIDVGFDRNDTAMQHLFYNVSGAWQNSQLPGAIMVRAVVGDDIPFGVGMPGEAACPDVRIVPNPATEAVQVQVPLGGSWSVVDLQGRCLMRQELTAGRTILDVSQLPAGSYVVLIGQGREQKYIRKKLIIAR